MDPRRCNALRQAPDPGRFSISLPGYLDALRMLLTGPLPGRRAHAAMLPSWRREVPDSHEGFRSASVLIILYPENGRLRFPLIERSSGPRPHDGQIALPGGAVESGESGEAAALREAREELGFDPSSLDLAGRLTPVAVSVSRFLMTPFVAVATERPDFRPAPAEVAAWFSVDLEELMEETSMTTATVRHDGADRSVPCFRLAGSAVWGATAMALSEFAELARRAAQRGALRG